MEWRGRRNGEGSCKKTQSSGQERVGSLAHLMPPQMIRTSEMINAHCPSHTCIRSRYGKPKQRASEQDAYSLHVFGLICHETEQTGAKQAEMTLFWPRKQSHHHERGRHVLMTRDAEEAAAREDHDLHSQTSVKQAALPEQPSSSIPLARSLARVAQKAIRDRGEMTMVNGGGAEEGRDQRERRRERRPRQSRSCDAMQGKTARVNGTFVFFDKLRHITHTSTW